MARSDPGPLARSAPGPEPTSPCQPRPIGAITTPTPPGSSPRALPASTVGKSRAASPARVSTTTSLAPPLESARSPLANRPAAPPLTAPLEPRRPARPAEHHTSGNRGPSRSAGTPPPAPASPTWPAPTNPGPTRCPSETHRPPTPPVRARPCPPWTPPDTAALAAARTPIPAPTAPPNAPPRSRPAPTPRSRPPPRRARPDAVETRAPASDPLPPRRPRPPVANPDTPEPSADGPASAAMTSAASYDRPAARRATGTEDTVASARPHAGLLDLSARRPERLAHPMPPTAHTRHLGPGFVPQKHHPHWAATAHLAPHPPASISQHPTGPRPRPRTRQPSHHHRCAGQRPHPCDLYRTRQPPATADRRLRQPRGQPLHRNARRDSTTPTASADRRPGAKTSVTTSSRAHRRAVPTTHDPAPTSATDPVSHRATRHGHPYQTKLC